MTCTHKVFTWPILLILAAYLALATIYGLVTPIFEAPDEPQHFFFAKHLADGKGLPVQGKATSSIWAQEGSQPPLYYALVALVISALDTSDAEELLWLNPHANVGVPLKEGNKNTYIHTDRERFPWRGTVLAVHLARLLSTLMGTGTVLATYAIMRLAFPGQPALAIGAAALNAFTPQFLFISGAVNNDNLVILLCSWAFWALLRLWVHSFTWRAGIGLGLLMGGAALAKLSGLGLFPLLILTLALLAWRGRPWRTLVALGATAPLVALAVCGWWFARNLRLYGDLTGLSAMLEVFGRREVTPSLAELLGEAEGLRISYWAIFGWFNILSWSPIYKLLDLLLLVAAAGLGFGLWRGYKRASERALAWGLLASAWFAIILVALVRWTRMTSGTQGRLLFPAISALSGLFFVGLAQWIPHDRRRWLAAGLGGAFFSWAVFCPFVHIAPAYARPRILSEDEALRAGQPVHITFGDKLELISYYLDRPSAFPGESFHITAYWRCLAPIERDYSIYVHLFGLGGQSIGQLDSYPGGGTYPTSLWLSGQVIEDRYALTISPEAQAPVLARIEIGPYLLHNDAPSLPAFDGQGRPLGSPLVGRIRVAAPPPIHYKIPQRVEGAPREGLVFGDRIALLGYDLDKTDARAGESLRLTLYWQVLRPLDADYTVFVHVGLAGSAGQDDSQPRGGDYPTRAWYPGEIVPDTHLVPLRPGVSGRYPLLVGLYLLESGQRLPLATGEDHAALGEIAVSW